MIGLTRITLAALAAGGLVSCTQQGSTQEIEFRVPVQVREVETGTVEDQIVATGTLRAGHLDRFA